MGLKEAKILSTRRKVLTSLTASVGLSASNLTFGRTGSLPKVGFIYVGPVGDGGWTFAHEQGRLAAERTLGGQFESIVVERVPESQQADQVFREMIGMGAQLIFATTFGYRDTIRRLAPRYPNVHFEHCTGYESSRNVSTYDVRRYEACYLAGILAGLTSRTGQLGVIGAIPIPDVIRSINAFTIGAREVNKKSVVHLEWANTWFDPKQEGRIADLLLARGADTLLQTTDSPSILQRARVRGAKAFGMDSDMSHYAPEAHLGSAASLWGPYYTQRIKAHLDESLRSSDTWWGFAESAVDLVGLPQHLSAEVVAQIEARRTDLKLGNWSVFKGPLYSNTGTLMLPDGPATDIDLATMKLLVAGVKGRVP